MDPVRDAARRLLGWPLEEPQLLDPRRQRDARSLPVRHRRRRQRGGAFIDNIVVKNGGTTLFTDNVEGGANGWTAAGGFKISTGSESVIGDRYYIAENRTYVGYDAGLQVGPYQFSFALTDPDKVEHFAFEDGLLVWVVDESYTPTTTTASTPAGASPFRSTPDPCRSSTATAPSRAIGASRSTRPSVSRTCRQGRTTIPRRSRTRCRARACTSSTGPGPSSHRSSRTTARGRRRPSEQHRPLPRQRRERLLDHRQPAELGEDRRIGVSLRVISQNTGGNLIVDIDNAPAP